MIKRAIIFSVCLIAGCRGLDPYLRQTEIDSRQGKVKIINSVGFNKEAENVNLIGRPFKDPNVPGVVRQEYSLQVDF
jgi:hypothetical protein